MKIITKGHELDDAVRQVLQLFFDISTDFTVESSLIENNNVYEAAATITIGDKKACGEAKKQLFSPERKNISDLIKKSVFFACKKLNFTYWWKNAVAGGFQ